MPQLGSPPIEERGMGKTFRMRSQDLLAVHRLVGECRELGDDPTLWRHRLCQGFQELVGADVVLPGEISGYLRGPLRRDGFTDWGLESDSVRDRMLRAYEDSIQTVARRSDAFQVLREAVRRAGAGTFLRRQLFPDGVWYRSWDSEMLGDVANVDQSLYVAHPVGGGGDRFMVTHMYRAKGCPRFGERERQIAQVLHAEATALVGGPLASYADPAPSDLPPRAREVLRRLLEGEGDKQIAKALRLSPHTVNQYVKAIFEHFQVVSRAELLARWVRRGWSSRAAWLSAPNGRP
jgi:DNA-binding NarL/FixJ family response regulator